MGCTGLNEVVRSRTISVRRVSSGGQSSGGRASLNDSGWIAMVGGAAGFAVQSVVFCCMCGVQRINLIFLGLSP